MGGFNIARYAILGFLLATGIATLGLSANLLSLYMASPEAIIPVFIPLDLAVGVITLIIVVPPLVIDFFRKGAFTSMVAVEIGWTFLIMVLWIAAGGQTTSQLQLFPKTCNFEEFFNGREVADEAANSVCRQVLATEALTWLGFVGSLAWLITLISCAATAHSRGNPSVWKQPVTGTRFTARVANTRNAQTDYQQYPSSQPTPQLTEYVQQPYPQQPYPPQPTSYPSSSQYPAGYNVSPGVAQV